MPFIQSSQPSFLSYSQANLDVFHRVKPTFMPFIQSANHHAIHTVSQPSCLSYSQANLHSFNTAKPTFMPFIRSSQPFCLLYSQANLHAFHTDSQICFQKLKNTVTVILWHKTLMFDLSKGLPWFILHK